MKHTKLILSSIISIFILLLPNYHTLLCVAAPKAAATSITTSPPKPQFISLIQTPFQNFVQTVIDAKHHLAAAAAARGVSIFVMYPVDTIKTRLQMGQKLKFDGLYKGVGESLTGQVPYGVLTFGSYEVYKKSLVKNFPNTKPVFLYALAAIFGDITGSFWLCPSEVVKQQLQGGMYATTGEALRSIWTKRGFLGFYQGYFGGLARDVPFRVAQLTSYEVTKNLYLRLKKQRIMAQQSSGTSTATKKKDKGAKGVEEDEKLELSPLDSAICGAVAGSFSAAVTSPLDRIKTLLMTNSEAYGGSVFSCANKIWRDEGIAGFCAGIVPRVTYIAPSVVIFFIVYEQVQQRLAN